MNSYPNICKLINTMETEGYICQTAHSVLKKHISRLKIARDISCPLKPCNSSVNKPLPGLGNILIEYFVSLILIFSEIELLLLLSDTTGTLKCVDLLVIHKFGSMYA